MVNWNEEVKKVNSSTGNPGNAFSGGIFWKNEVSQLNKLGGEEWVKERRKQEEEKRKPFDEWARRYNAVIDGFKKYENQRNGGYTKDASGGYGAEIDALIGEFDGIRNIARVYGDGDARQYLYTLQDIKKYIGETDSMMAQFRDEDAFNRYVKEQTAAGRQEIYQENADRMAELDRQIEDARKWAEGKEGIEQAAAEFTAASRYGYVDPLGWTSSAQIELKELQAQKEQLKAQQLAYERTQKAADESAEMQDKARGVDKSYNGDMSDRLGTWANADEKAKQMAAEYLMQDKTEKVAGMDIYANLVAGQDGQQLKRSQIIAAGEEAGWEHLTEDEWNTYYYLRRHSGQAAADRWLDGMTSILQRRRVEQMEKEQENLTVGQRIWTNAASLVTNTAGGILGFADDVAQTMKGQDVSPYNSAHFAQNYTGAVRQKTAEAIEKEFEGKNKKLGKYASNTYQAIMSGLDSAIGGTLGMGMGYDVVMGMGAASQRARELYEQGASRGQIALGAVGSGVIEALFEHVSLEVFASNYLEKPTKGFWNFVGKTLIQAGVEGSEEVATELGNMVWDAVVRGTNSDNQRAIRAYEADGKSKEEAWKLAAKDKAEEIYWAFFGGAVSGGAFGGVGGGFNLAVDRMQNRAFYDQRGRNVLRNGTGQTVMEQARDAGIDINDKVRQLAAEKAQLSVEEFNQLSRREQNRASRAMGKVYEALTDHQAQQVGTAKEDAFRQRVQQALEERGVENPEEAARVLTKANYEGKLTKEESRLYDSVKGNEVLSQLANDRTVRQEEQRNQDSRLETLRNTWNQGADEQSEHNPTRQRERLQDTAQDFEGREEMIASWQEGQEPEEYARGYEQVYRMGQEGIDEKYVKDSLAAQGLTEEQKQAAYNAGKESRNGEDYLRQGQEWNDRANDGSTAQTVAEGTAGEEGSRPGTEGEAGRNVPGRLTSAAELGIPGGSTKQTLRVRSEDRYTEADRKAVAHAKEHGLECVLVEGDRIFTYDEEGKGKHYTKARAVIAGNKMFVQADNPDFNSYQLARHEAGHRQLDSGKVSRAEVRQQLRKRYTEAQIEDICGLYAAAYGDSGLTAEEIFDEILCDALGEMNAFATEGQERNAGEVGLFLRDVARAEENSRTTENAADSSEGKSSYSREMATMADLKEENKHLKERVEFWKEQAHPSKGARANRQDVREMAKHLLGAYGSKTSTDQMARKIQELADYIISNNKGAGVDLDKVRTMAEDAAWMLLGGCSVNVNESTEAIWQDLRRTLRNTKIEVTTQVKEGIADFDDFRKRNRFNMHFRAEGDGGTKIENIWKDFQERYGTDIFSEDITAPGEQLLELEDMLVRMTPEMQNPYRHEWSMTVQLVRNDIINTVMGEDIRQEGEERENKAADPETGPGYQDAYRKAEKEWLDEADSMRTDKNQEILEKAGQFVTDMGQRYRSRENSLRKEMDAKDKRRQEKVNKRLAQKEEYMQERIFYVRIRERNRIEQAKQSEGRRKIARLAGQFEKMAGAKPGKGMTQHAPAQMLRDISELCRTFEESQLRGAEGYSEKLRQRLEALDAKRDTMTAEQYAEEVAKIQRQTDRNAQAKARITETMEAYAKMAKQEGTAYNEEVHKQLAEVQGMLAGTSISEMTSGQLEQVYTAMQGLMYTVKHANEAFTMGKQKTYTEMAKKLTGQIKAVNATAHGIRSAAQRFGMWQMNPDTFFNMLCGYAKGNEGQVVQKAFANGTQRMLEVQREYAETMQPLMELKSVQQMMGKPMKQTYSFGLKNEKGNDISTSRGMMLQIYMLLSQEDSFRSLVYGGFRVPNQEVYYKGDISGAYGNAEEGTTHAFGLGLDYQAMVKERKELYQELDRLGDEATEEDKERISKRLGELKEDALKLISGSEMKLREVKDNIFRQLTEEDLRCIKAAREWYKRTGLMMADTYEQMNGFRPKLVEDYVPIHRDPNSLVLDIREDNVDKAFNLEGSGFTKERVKSTAPILLTDFWQELEGQSAKMARYVGFAGVQKDFGKIWKTKVDGRTVNELVVEKYGAGKTTFGVSGEEYIKHYIMSVAGSSGNQGVLNRIYGNYAGATLRMNPRVAVSQLASILTAASVVGWKNMAVGFARGVGISTSTDKKNQLARDSVWFYQRYRGANGATELSDIKRRNDPMERMANTKWGKALFNWCQEMDVFATASMWCMAEEQAKAKGIKPESEEFKAAVNEIYTDIIRKSQPNYTPTERADILRDQRNGMKLLTMFKTQSNQNLNLLINANGEYMKYKQDLKNKRNGVTEADVKQKREQLANAYTSVILGGTVGFTLIRMAANFLMGAVNAYRDDETGEVTAAATAKGVAKEIGSSLAGMVALGGQLYDIVWATCSGEDFYGISDSAIGAISDLVKNFVKLINDAKDPDKDLTVKHWRKLVQSSGSVLGTPVGNALKFWDGMEMWYKDITGGTLGQFTTDATSSRQYRERVLKYWQEGNQEKMDRALAALIMNSGESTDWEARKKVSQDIANYLVKDKYLDGELTDTEAEELLRAVGHEDPGGKVRDWDTALIQGAWEDGELTDKEAERRLKEAGYSETKASEKVAKWNLDRTKKAWESGSIDRAGAIRQLKEQGYDAQKAGKTVMNWALDKTEMEWKNGQLTDSQARKKLMEAGLTAEEARTKLLVWGFAEKYPNMDMSAKAIEVFYRTNGIPVEIVNKAWSQTTKDDTVNYIMSTSLSSEKKREMWKAINTDKGWSDKRTPWE